LQVALLLLEDGELLLELLLLFLQLFQRALVCVGKGWRRVASKIGG
jgi:hypothetical protein